MNSICRVALFLLAIILFPWMSESLSDTIYAGSTYLMSSVVAGDDYYLGCGGDSICSILTIADAEVHDGWTAVDEGSATWGFQSYIDHNWCLDVHSNGYNIFANSDITNTLGQIWALYPWPDGTYRLYNNYWQSNLDVQDNVTPFVNSYAGDTSNLLGQRWYSLRNHPQENFSYDYSILAFSDQLHVDNSSKGPDQQGIIGFVGLKIVIATD